MNISQIETLTDEIFEVIQGWKNSTYGWQSSINADISEANYKKALEGHNNKCKQLIVKLLQSRLAEGEQEPWQPIETAPKEASHILIYFPKLNQVQEVWWAIPYEGATNGYWSTPISPSGRGYIILPTSPTHWMPLPAAPQGAPK